MECENDSIWLPKSCQNARQAGREALWIAFGRFPKRCTKIYRKLYRKMFEKGVKMGSHFSPKTRCWPRKGPQDSLRRALGLFWMHLWVFFGKNVCFFVAPTSVQDPELRLAPVQDLRLKLTTLALIFVRSRPRTIRGFRAIFHMRRLGSLSGPGQALVRISWVPGFPVWGLGPCLSLARLLVRDRY